MSVLTDYYSVILRLETVSQKYPGGVDQYAKDCPNGTFCKDDHLARVGFMAWDDAVAYIARLQRIISPLTKHEVAVICQFNSFCNPCDWLEYTLHEDGLAFCWLKGTEPSELSAPEYWTPDHIKKSKENYVADESQVEFVKHENGMDTYRNKLTGELTKTGRVGVRSLPAESGKVQLSDEEYGKHIVGLWGVMPGDEPIDKKLVVNFNQDMSFTFVLIGDEEKMTGIDFAGTWLVKDGWLTLKITGTNSPEIIPLEESKEQIVRFYTDRFKTEDEDGISVLYVKIE